MGLSCDHCTGPRIQVEEHDRNPDDILAYSPRAQFFRITLRNCFLDFAVEHWFGCRATEPGFAREIGAIEVWLIDWLIDWLVDNLVVYMGKEHTRLSAYTINIQYKEDKQKQKVELHLRIIEPELQLDQI